jgi:DNA-binding NarL/FixJ family response regulator
MTTIRVLLVDDHAHARQGMREILALDARFEVVGEAEDGLRAMESVEKWMPDLIIMDIHMKTMDGLEATKRIKAIYPYIKIVIVTVSDDILNLFEAIKRGAQGYLLKNLKPSAWLAYLQAIANDEAPMSKDLAYQLLQEFQLAKRSEGQHPRLTERETSILKLVASGVSNKEIADRLFISEHTVKNHMKNIMQKLHLENRVQLTKFAFESGLV